MNFRNVAVFLTITVIALGAVLLMLISIVRNGVADIVTTAIAVLAVIVAIPSIVTLATPSASEEQQKSFWYRLFHPQRPDNRKNLIANVRKAWIEGVLEKALVDDRLLTLVGKAELQAVERPRIERVVRRPKDQDYHLTSSADIERVYQELGRELLILGAHGSGKTITLLELGQQLLEQAERDPAAPIPVVFNLSSWAVKRAPLEEWLLEQLHLDYSVSKKLAKKWLEAGILTLFLDGLDEVQGTTANQKEQEEQSQKKYQEECIQAINRFWQRYNLGSNGIVICSRVADYQELDTRLQFENAHTALLLQPLTLIEVRKYLVHLGKEWNGLLQAFDTDDKIKELSTSPLLLNILTIAYQDLPLIQITGFTNEADQKNHLFKMYINRCLLMKGGKKDIPQKQIRDQLAWLGRKMKAYGKTPFYIEYLDYRWLESEIQRKQYRLSIILISVLFSGVMCGMIVWSVAGLIEGLIGGVIGGLIVGLMFGLLLGPSVEFGPIFGVIVHVNSGYINQFAEILTFSWSKLRRALLLGLVSGLMSVLIYALVAGSRFDLSLVLRFGLTTGLIVGVFFGLVDALNFEQVNLKTIPNQAIWLSARSAIIVWFSTGLIIGLSLAPRYDLISGLKAGAFIGMMLASMYGGGAVIIHVALRLVLYCSHFIPWNYAKFLNYAADHHLLRKVGGGYIFRHRMLMDYFASLKDS